jgi:hypothetical protein
VYIWVLLAYQHIQRIRHLTTQACLLDCSHTGGNHQRPEDRRGSKANCSNDCFIHPFLLTNHRQHTT